MSSRGAMNKNLIIKLSAVQNLTIKSDYLNIVSNNKLYDYENNFRYLITYNSKIYSYIFSISKKIYKYLESPYKSKCSYYNNKTPFNSISKEDCIRQCIRYYCELRLNCSVNILNGIISEFDKEFNNFLYCNESEINKCESLQFNLTIDCDKYCSIDCIYEELSVNDHQYVTLIREFSLIEWDTKQPFISYTETPIMTFNDYICYIGGLFGLLCGISFKKIYECIIVIITFVYYKLFQFIFDFTNRYM